MGKLLPSNYAPDEGEEVITIVHIARPAQATRYTCLVLRCVTFGTRSHWSAVKYRGRARGYTVYQQAMHYARSSRYSIALEAFSGMPIKTKADLTMEALRNGS